MNVFSLSMRIRPTILLFGDSITEFAFGVGGKLGWASLLSAQYSRRADVLSRGFSGYNTKHALDVLPSIFGDPNDVNTANTNLLFCTVFFGANDCSLPSARQHLDIEDFDANIRSIVSKIRSQTESSSKESHGLEAEVPIILFTPPPVDSEAWDHYCSVISPRPLSPRSNSNSKKYGERVTAIGHELNCLVVDTHKLLGGDKDKSYYGQYLTDGLHLTEEGNRKLFDGIMDAIRIEHKHLLPIEDGDVGVPMEEKLWSELC